MANLVGFAVASVHARSAGASTENWGHPCAVSSCRPLRRGRAVSVNAVKVSKGLSVLEWTGNLVPQGVLVKARGGIRLGEAAGGGARGLAERVHHCPRPRRRRGPRRSRPAYPVSAPRTATQGVKTTWTALWTAFMTELAPRDASGAYVRPKYTSRGTIGQTPDLPAEPGRYHLYVGNACPWCHRCTLALAALGLDRSSVSVTVMTDDAERASRGGWVFEHDRPDPVFGGKRDLREVYDALEQAETGDPGATYTGRCTAPLLVDRITKRMVSNESADILRMLGTSSAGLAGPGPSSESAASFSTSTPSPLRPAGREADVDTAVAWIYADVNNAVYRSGFATTQAAYDAAQASLWPALDRAEAALSGSATGWLLGTDAPSEADVCLFPTAVRFDAVYTSLFKCGRHRIAGGRYPNLLAWMRRMWALPGVADTFDVDAARRSYFGQLFPLNPGGVVPDGPRMDAVLGLEGEQ